MPCVCDRCNRNAATLGLTGKAISQTVLRKTFRAAAKKWHPDKFANQPELRLEAEETFKQIQVAYRELWEHLEAPIILEPEGEAVRPVRAAAAPEAKFPRIFFGGLPGCYTAPNFPHYVSEILTNRMHENEQALAFIEMSHRAPLGGPPAEYVLLTSYRIFVRGSLRTITMLWYTDLGEIRLVDQLKYGKIGFGRRIVASLTGVQHQYSLEIHRRDGSLFYALKGVVDDSAKKVIYNFLRQMKA